ncbi:MAG: NADPH-dependent F420 reductase [Anaerolineales bacterium]|nr:MAG: NADPH-dependent F420 reductase [Anaerolineales bacterium]
MTEKPTIAILGGTGHEGTGLALRWASNGYKVIIGSRMEEKALQVTGELNELLGEELIRGMENGAAAREADINVLTVVASAHEAALNGLKDDLKGKILVDATARIQFPNPKPPGPPSAARMAQELLGEDVRVVAAFQNIPASTLKDLEKELDSDVLVCADNREDADQVGELIRGAGMKAYYVGNLDIAITLEGLTAVLVYLNKYNNLKHASIKIVGS